MRNPTKYTLQESVGWEEFEDVCCSFLYLNGHKGIKKAGKVKDKGRDAVMLIDHKEGKIYQFSKEQNPLARKTSKFWREYKKWKDSDEVKEFIFVSNQDLGSAKIDLQKDLKNPTVEIYDITDLVNFLDYDDGGKDLKKNYAIFNKDFQEIFGAENKLEKLSEVADVINKDENYNVVTILAEQDQLRIPGAAFSSSSGNATQVFIPKSKEHFDRATPTVKFNLVAPNTPEGKELIEKYRDAIKNGSNVTLSPDNVKDLQFRLGEKLIFDGGGKDVIVELKTLTSDNPLPYILRSSRNPEIFIKTALRRVDAGSDRPTLNNYEGKPPFEFGLFFDLQEKSVQVKYSFQLDRCYDAHEAFIYLNLLSEFNQCPIDVIFDDHGIERPLIQMPTSKNANVPTEYLETLRQMSEIQRHFKVRIPNPLKNKLSKSDIWSVKKLYEIIKNGQTDIAITKLSFAIPSEVLQNMETTKNDDGTLAMVFGSKEVFEPISILGVTDFVKLEIVLPKAKYTAHDMGNGQAFIVVEVVEESAYLKSTDTKTE